MAKWRLEIGPGHAEIGRADGGEKFFSPRRIAVGLKFIGRLSKKLEFDY